MTLPSSYSIRALALAGALLPAFAAATPAFALQGIGDQPAADSTAPVILNGPVLVPGPSPRAPLVALVRVETDELTTVTFSIKDGLRSWRFLAEPKLKLVHEVPVLGVRPGRMHSIQVTVRDVRGNETTSQTQLVWTTPSLPPEFPPMQTTVSVPFQMERGVTLFDAASTPPHPGYFIMVDMAGEVIWYFEPEGGIGDVRRLRNGNFLCLQGHHDAMEFDVLGNVVQRWYAAGLDPTPAPPGAVLVDTDSFHHEIGELPTGDDGDFVTLSSELRTYPDYPANEIDQTITDPFADVIGDVIVEFRRDGTIVNEINLFDVLDPYRVCYDSLGGFWNNTYGITPTRDWSHGNAVIYLPFDDTYVVSLRSQDAVVKLKRSTGELVWILGPHERWTQPWSNYLLEPVGSPFEWNYHQHAPESQTDGGDILLYDNGNGRATPPTAQMPWDLRYSRAVRFHVDPVAMTAEQIWAYGGAGSEIFYSATRGDADRMRLTRNVLSVDADRKTAQTGAPAYARLVELTHTDPPQIVFEHYVRELSTTAPRTWNVYRAERLSSVYAHL